MTVLLIVVMAVLAVMPAVVAHDLLSDVPRVARWLARHAVRILRPGDRAFFGWIEEIEHASEEAAKGLRSHLSVFAIATGMFGTAVGRRVKVRRRIHLAVQTESSPTAAKINFPIYDDEGPAGESVWAEWVGESDRGDLYRITNHLFFCDLAAYGDIVRTRFEPLEEMPGYGLLHFVEVVTPADGVVISMILPRRHVFRTRRDRRLRLRLAEAGIFAEWFTDRAARGTLPDEPAHEGVIELLDRHHVWWEVFEREDPRDPDVP